MNKYNNLQVPYLLAFVVISIVIPETAQVWTFTTTVSVRPGTNRLSCFPLEKANEQGIKVFHASWKKRPAENHPWNWLGGVSDPGNHAKVRTAEGTHPRYILFGVNATLEIQGVTKDDNDDEYMCSGRGDQGFRESFIKKLSFFEPDETNCTCPEIYNNCSCSTCNCTDASGAPKETTTGYSSTDVKCTTWIIGFVFLLLFCLRSYIIVLVRIVRQKISSYCCTCQRNANLNPPNELRDEISSSNVNVSYGEDWKTVSQLDCGDHDSRELEGPYYSLPESNGDNENYITESV